MTPDTTMPQVHPDCSTGCPTLPCHNPNCPHKNSTLSQNSNVRYDEPKSYQDMMTEEQKFHWLNKTRDRLRHNEKNRRRRIAKKQVAKQTKKRNRRK